MANETKWTPGPWEQIPQHGAGPMIARKYDTGKQMNPVGLRLVCHMLMRGNSLDEDKANARLVASAPELYDTLAGVLDIYAAVMSTDACAVISEVLAKARGDS